MRFLSWLYRFLENTYYTKTARFYKGWRIHYSRTLELSLLLNLDHIIDYLIYRYDVFEPRVLGTIRDLLKDREIAAFVDVGSNIGQMSLYVAKHYPAIRVVSYEPVPASYNQQISSMLINNLSYELHNLAITNQAKAITLYLPKLDKAADLGKLNPGMASQHLDQFRSEEGAVTVGGVPLANEFDRMGLGRVEGYILIKIDVEGAELEVLEGLKPYFSGGPGLIILVELLFEYHYEKCCRVVELLLGSGFIMYDLQRRPIGGVEEVDEAETDFIFLKSPAA